jgi:hypothetical protein
VAHAYNPNYSGGRDRRIRRITVLSQPGQIVCETLSQKTLHKYRAGRVAQGEGSAPVLQKKKKKKERKELNGRCQAPQRNAKSIDFHLHFHAFLSNIFN